MEENKDKIQNIPLPLAELAQPKKEAVDRLEGRPVEERPVEEYEQKVLDIARVTRVTKGGKRFTFRAAIVIGNRTGKVGFGIGKGRDVAQSVEKAFKQAKKHLIEVALKGDTIPHEVQIKLSSASVMLKPAARGSGVRAGGALRVVA